MLFTDLKCTCAADPDPERKGDTDVTIGCIYADVEGVRAQKSGKIAKYYSCPICLCVHSALQQVAEMAFEASRCPNGHDAWQAWIKHVWRHGDQSWDNVTFEFVVQLRCKICKETFDLPSGEVRGPITRINGVSITAKGLRFELEQRQDQIDRYKSLSAESETKGVDINQSMEGEQDSPRLFPARPQSGDARLSPSFIKELVRSKEQVARIRFDNTESERSGVALLAVGKYSTRIYRDGSYGLTDKAQLTELRDAGIHPRIVE